MDKIERVFYWIAITLLGVQGLNFIYRDINYKKILVPRNKQVEQNYVQPNKLENITVEDLGDGKNRTTIEYEGHKFLFMLDEKGRPYISDFNVKPVEIKPAEVVTQEYKIK